MKLTIKMALIIFLITIVTSAKARPIISITYSGPKNEAIQIKESVIKKLNIPKILIRLAWKKNPCKNNQSIAMQICMDKNGKIDIPYINQKMMNESFVIFSRKERL